MEYFKTVISFLFFLLCFFYCSAQENNQQKYVYQDSSIQAADTASAQVVEDQTTAANSAQAPIDDDDVLADTALRPNSLMISADSINQLKNSPSFAYTKNLDSLLKVWQKEHEVKIDVPSTVPGAMDNFFASGTTQIFLWALAGLFILFILYKLFFIESGFSRRQIKNNVNEIPESETVSGTFNYDQLISQAVNNRNYRLAVRYLYLLSLQKLAGKNLVQLAVDKTNYQYVAELNNSIYKNDFAGLTLNYEYVWYGEFELDDETFRQLHSKFNQFNSSL